MTAFRTIVTQISLDGNPSVARLPADAQRVEFPGAASKVLHDATPVKLWLDTAPGFATSWQPSQPKNPARREPDVVAPIRRRRPSSSRSATPSRSATGRT